MTDELKNKISKIDKNYENKPKGDFALPAFDGRTHYLEVARSTYFQALTVLRHYIKRACDVYWGDIQNAYNVDLFMITQSVSSPSGPGSDSETIHIRFGDSEAYLVDSSQFGFEPLLLNNIKKVYCYLPSMRGETPDSRHLNQFYHCEAEIAGTLDELKPQIESYVKFLAETLLFMPNIAGLLSAFPDSTFSKLRSLLEIDKFHEIEFEDAVKILKNSGNVSLVNETKFGCDISSKGELKLMELLKNETPLWVNHF